VYLYVCVCVCISVCICVFMCDSCMLCMGVNME